MSEEPGYKHHRTLRLPDLLCETGWTRESILTVSVRERAWLVPLSTRVVLGSTQVVVAVGEVEMLVEEA